jgi:DNA mismatch repair protein MutL
VKFVNPQEAFRAVQAAIRGVLEQAPWLQQNPETSIGVGEVPSVGFSYQDQTRTSLSTHSFQAGTPQGSASSATSLEAPLANPMAKSFVSAPIQPVNLEFSDEAFKTTQFRTKADIKTELLGGDRIEGHTLEGSFEGHFEGQSPADTVLILSPLETTGPTNERSYVEKGKNSSEKNSPPLIRHWSLLQVIGQAGLTYVVCQSEKGIVLIDQHAAHERVAFERLMNAWRGKKIEVQDFLFPLSIDLNEEKVEALRAHFGELEKLGIEIEELGPTTLGVKSAPAILKDRVLVEEIERFANEILDWGDSPLLEKAMGDICARMACHSVLRAGQSLSVPEMARLLEEMDEYPLSSFCPHGRPVSVTYSWPELEKDFGRRL